LRQDRIGWQHRKGGRPEHRGGFPNRFEIALENLKKEEAAQVLLLLDKMQREREEMTEKA